MKHKFHEVKVSNAGIKIRFLYPVRHFYKFDFNEELLNISRSFLLIKYKIEN
ncbi:unnamed protein product [marine sediment metagenome]|uniref:Uncharacterized protein n=1 Tax=marine sediment metagenome TaxID=412755 RepID=X1IM24_9ZZZZ